MGLLGMALQPLSLTVLAIALSGASLLNYVTYTGEFTVVSAVDMALAVVAGATYIACAVAAECWLGLLCAAATMAAYAGRRSADDQINVHLLALLSLLLYIIHE